MGRKRFFLQFIFTCGFGMFIAILIFEIIMRIPLVPYRHRSNQVLRASTVTVYENIPNISIPSRYGKFMININSDGLRDYEIDVSKDKNIILFLGDSFTAGEDVPLGDTFIKQLERLINSNRPDEEKFRTVNAGVGGYSTIQEYMYLKEKGIKFKPKIVICDFFMNDLEDNMRDIKYYEFSDSDIVMKKEIREKISSRREEVKNPPPMSRYPFIAFLRTHSYTFRWMEKARRTFMLDAIAMKGYLDLFKIEHSDLSEEKYALAKETLRLMNDFCKTRGIKFVVLIIPEGFQVNDEFFYSRLKRFGFSRQDYDIDKPSVVLSNWCRENGIPYLDLLGIFRESVKEARQPYLKQLAHFQKEGHRIVAGQLYRYLNERGILQ
jgi:hypothetical protein